MQWDAIVIGAGVAGLQCARQLQAAGRRVRVLDKARGVGGRCATRRFEGQPVDFGPLFVHGHQEAFLEAVAEVDAARLENWPRRVVGTGVPCQPDAFAPFERRTSFVDGLSVFPKHLARGLDVALQTRVRRLEPSSDGLTVHLYLGEPLQARDVVIALPLEQIQGLLADVPDSAELRSARGLLSMFTSLPSLTVIAGYPAGTAEPDWDVRYPEDSDLLLLLAHDSGKRPAPRQLVMVYQARPRWSRGLLEKDADLWQAAILDEAARLLGAWAALPSWTYPHRWRYARVDRGNELSQPLLLHTDGGGRIGLCGDIFAPGGGVQASWLSGRALAARLLDEE